METIKINHLYNRQTYQFWTKQFFYIANLSPLKKGMALHFHKTEISYPKGYFAYFISMEIRSVVLETKINPEKYYLCDYKQQIFAIYSVTFFMAVDTAAEENSSLVTQRQLSVWTFESSTSSSLTSTACTT